MRLSNSARSQLGFSLIELMIIVVIIGILASIAIPNYNQYIRRSRAADATTALANARVRMEQFFQDNRTYTGFPAASCPPNTQYFTFACTPGSATTYTLTATGAGNMSNFSFSIDQANARTSQFDGTVGASCWLTAKGGQC